MARSRAKDNYNLLLNAVLISFTIVTWVSIQQNTLVSYVINWQSFGTKTPQVQEFMPLKRGLPMRREGGGCR